MSAYILAHLFQRFIIAVPLENDDMAQAKVPGPVLFLTGVLAADMDSLQATRALIEQRWGPILAASPVWPFDHSSYYREQTGGSILRMFFAFAGPFQRELLSERKRQSNDFELELAAARGGAGPQRPVNLDPGYLAPEKLVLASCKNFAHRIYIGSGVFAEVTLLYRHNRFEALEWTFPDYASGRYFPFFTELRRTMMSEWYV